MRTVAILLLMAFGWSAPTPGSGFIASPPKRLGARNSAALCSPRLRRSLRGGAPRRDATKYCMACDLHVVLPAALKMDMNDQWGLWAVVSAAAWAGIRSEDTPMGRALSGAVIAMLCGAGLALIGVIPAGPCPPIVELQSVAVALATPLLLLGANLKVILRSTGQMLMAFFCGALGTTLGAVLGFYLMCGPLSSSLGPSGWQVAACLAAKNIGGGLNFIGVASALQVDTAAVATALAVDNVLGLLYFPLCGYLCRFAHEGRDKDEGGTTVEFSGGEEAHTIQSLAGALCLATSIAALAGKVGTAMAVAPQTIAVVISVLVATVFARTLRAVSVTADLIGRQLLYMFFACAGTSSVSASIGSASTLALLKFDLIVYSCHMAVALALGRLLALPLSDTLLASNANIGNPATAAAMARSRGWQNKVLPAMLCGTAGNILATSIGLALARLVFLPMASSWLL